MGYLADECLRQRIASEIYNPISSAHNTVHAFLPNITAPIFYHLIPLQSIKVILETLFAIEVSYCKLERMI